MDARLLPMPVLIDHEEDLATTLGFCSSAGAWAARIVDWAMPTMDVGSGQGCRRWALLPDDESRHSLLSVSLPGVAARFPSKVAAAGAITMELDRSVRSRDAMAAGSSSDLTVAGGGFNGASLGKMEHRNQCFGGA
ncbi:hypothetical protein ACLOJK_006535 [Asimina triloba]